MNIFGNRVADISARSESAIGVFTKTVQKLKAINSDSIAAREKNQTELDRLNSENTHLAGIEAENSKMIFKIEEFLG